MFSKLYAGTAGLAAPPRSVTPSAQLPEGAKQPPDVRREPPKRLWPHVARSVSSSRGKREDTAAGRAAEARSAASGHGLDAEEKARLKGSYVKRPALGDACEAEEQQWEVAPLTALHPCEPATWASRRAREALYSNIPVDRVDGMHVHVSGRLPSWLHGSFYRNGPGKFQGAHAVFDGCAMLARFAVDGERQRVVVSHRFLDTTYYRAVLAANGEHRYTMAHDPKAGARSALGRLQYLAALGAGALAHGVSLGDNALISVFPQGSGALVAHTETLAGTYLVHPDTLETLGRVRYRDDEEISGQVKTAHPYLHPSGDVINLAADFMPVATYDRHLLRPPHMTLYRQPAGDLSRRIKLATIPYLRPHSPTWVHQAPVSENYAVVVQNPCFYDIEKMVFGESGEHLVFKWDPSAGSLIHVVPLDGIRPVKSFRAPAFMATHWINAFESEDGGLLHLDACVTKDPGIMAHWALDTVRAGAQGGKQIEVSVMRRLTLDLSAPDGAALSSRPLLRPLVDDAAHGHAFELPAINPARGGRPHRFVYAACAVRPSNCWNALAKADVEGGGVEVWHEPGAVCWEPVFCPHPGSSAEDEGVVLSTLMQADGRTALLVLDAQSWREVARAVLPYGLPNGFHGCFVPASDGGQDRAAGGSSS